MVYIAGQPHHRLKDAGIVDHLVRLVEEKAAEIEKASASAREPASVAR
jgi:(E)-4-hydroxy-3-methylbut-2-enyl-diphosphate synthase